VSNDSCHSSFELDSLEASGFAPRSESAQSPDLRLVPIAETEAADGSVWTTYAIRTALCADAFAHVQPDGSFLLSCADPFNSLLRDRVQEALASVASRAPEVPHV
jgi:hypothetical protein